MNTEANGLEPKPATGIFERSELWLWGVRQLLRHGRPSLLIHLVGGIGDELLCSCLLHELKRRGRRGVWLMTSRPDLFRCNPDCDVIVPHDHRYLGLARKVGATAVEPRYTRRISEDADLPPRRHVLRIMLAAVGVRGSAALRPYLHLRDEERSSAKWARDSIVVHTSGQGAVFHNRLKEYRLDRLQSVVDQLAKDHPIVQIGHTGDPLLNNVSDLRGRTSLRGSAALLSEARLFVGLEGGLMHIARAVECPSVIIFGGRLWPEQTGYTCNENLVTRPPCAPCWGWTRCDHQHVCMESIATEDVLAAVRRALDAKRGPLATEIAEIGDEDDEQYRADPDTLT